MNYLQLCQDYVSELGIAGGSAGNLPSAVTGQTGELKNVTRWIRDAALYIDNLWLDWKYLWQTYSGVATVGSATLPAPAVPVRLWDVNTLYYQQPSGGSWSRLDYLTRAKMRQQYDTLNATAGTPSAFTINPDNTLVLNCPADQAYNFKAEFWRQPVTLAANTDTPLIPAYFHRIIVARAAVMYGNKEDAPEIIAGLTAEYIDMLDKLQADQLEEYEARRSSTDRSRTDVQPFLGGWLG